MAYEALDSLQETLLQILKRDDDLTNRRVKQRIISIRDKAVFLQLNLKHFPEKETFKEIANTIQEIIQYVFSPENLSSDCGSMEPTDRLSDQLGELAEELESIAEDVVDYCKSNGHSFNDLGQRRDGSSSSKSALKSEDLTVATELIGRISNRLGRLAERIKSTAGKLVDYSSSIDDSPSESPLTSKDMVVGFDDDMLELMERLVVVGDKSNLKILPIVGMGGIGKSTLAKLVYDHSTVVEFFSIRAWVTISQDYSIESVLLNLLALVKGKVDRVGRDSLKGIETVQLEIYQILSGRRFLIVMDDMWSTEAWDHVRRLFPDDNNRSRIILTTRLMDVATYATYSHDVHMMRFLDYKHSWHLFQHKVFGDQDCPIELLDIGGKIVKGYGGLPLSIVTVAGLLSGIDRTPKLWQEIGVKNGWLQ